MEIKMKQGRHPVFGRNMTYILAVFVFESGDHERSHGLTTYLEMNIRYIDG